MGITIKYEIEFLSYWHIGTGLAGSTYADAIVNKNDNQLPIIPGKTIKGLLRDAAEQIHSFHENLVDRNFIEAVFGIKSDEVGVDITHEAKTFFTNVQLSNKLSQQIINKDLTDSLYKVLSNTEIDPDGQAKDGSLRQYEVTIPLTLYGALVDFPGDEYIKQLDYCFAFVKHMGLNRNRGLGRCKISKIK